LRCFSSATDSGAGMEKSMNQIEDLFSAAKDEVNKQDTSFKP
jgi:uncharacterized protein with von Willebrand factor type A (vWA) domain